MIIASLRYLRRTASDDVGEDDSEDLNRDRKSHLCAYSLSDREETVIPATPITSDYVRRKRWCRSRTTPSSTSRRQDRDQVMSTRSRDLTCNWIADCGGAGSASVASAANAGLLLLATMNGVDWKAMRDKYAALLPFVNNRNDLALTC